MAPDPRRDVVEYLRLQLIGPVGGPSECISSDTPDRRYLSGVLYPKRVAAGQVQVDDVVDDQGGAFGEENEDDPMVLANQQAPASLGLSFVAGGDSVVVSVACGRYELRERERIEPEADDVSDNGAPDTGQTAKSGPGHRSEKCWYRTPAEERARLTPSRPRVEVMGGNATVRSIWRPHPEGWIVTVALVNEAEAPGIPDPAACLYQVELSCSAAGGIRPYPTSGSFFRDEEDEEQAVLYRTLPTYAIGHGCSATWEVDPTGNVTVATTMLPEEEVPRADFTLDGFDDLLSVSRLAAIEADTEAVLGEMSAFVDAYDEWVAALDADVPEALESARDRILGRLAEASRRMRGGIELLRNDAEVLTAFGLANEAMLRQMTHSRAPFGAKRKRVGTFVLPTPDYSAEQRRWRPFQLAFLLLALPSASDPDHDERDTVDLIWFPTGGGKTEAYLGLIAFVVALRRMREGDAGAGTTVITRYTLRLLTSQQFQRAAVLICAMELLRRDGPDRLGSVPITIGVWVGMGTSPNSYEQAAELQSDLWKGERTQISFQVEVCPWCGPEIFPAEDRPSRANMGVEVEGRSLRLFCPNTTCPFHERLPLSSVDEDLYENPPTLLIATVDKFARAPWEERSKVFLGGGATPGPDLVIQDELHLISGPLGTIMGVYESAFDIVMQRAGRRPKVIASTATIRNASSQVRALFDRDVFLFPPSGVDADDSYFVRLRRDDPGSGRLYVGAMAQAHTPTTATVRALAGLLQAPQDLGMDDATADPFWTVVAYHNSLRELGKTVTLARDDIPARMQLIAAAEDDVRELEDDAVVELTSNIPSSEIPKRLEQLGHTKASGDAAGLVPCTNMISVGVDVQRLGLMVVIGQPKTTSEYIQATSRVGRSTPGLVLTLLSPAKSRDRSHFETFRSFHQSMYRSVEPTSVTPFALPARLRALHAALVVLVRFATGLSDNRAAVRFDPSVVSELRDALLRRVEMIEPEELDDTERHLDRLIAEWEEKTDLPNDLVYYDKSFQIPSLLRRWTDGRPDGWTTLDSMRSVDAETKLEVSW